MTRLIDNTKLYECPKELEARQYKDKTEREKALVSLAETLISISSQCNTFYKSQNTKKSALKQAMAVVRFAIKHYGILFPQSMFPREQVERHTYLYQLELLVPETFFNKVIFNHIIEGVQTHSITGNVKDKFIKIMGVTDFMEVEIKKAYRVSLDIPQETALVGSW